MSFFAHPQKPILALVAFAAVALALTILAGNASPSSAEQGQYLHFGGPGSGYLEVPDAPALSPTTEITIEAWLYLTSGSSWPNGSCPGFVGKGYTTSYWIGVSCGTLRLQFYPGGIGSATSSGALPTGEWVHAAVTYDGASVKFYINGVLDSTVPLVGALGTNDSPLRIGNDTDWGFTPIGHIDEVHIWKIVRSQQSVMADMDTITTPQIGLLGVWNMEGSPDSDIGGFTGTLNGDAEFAGEAITPSPSPEANYSKGDLTCDHAITTADVLRWLADLAGTDSQLTSCVNPLSITGAGSLSDTWWNASSGQGYIEVPDSPDLNPTDALSITLWVNLWSYYSPDGLNDCPSLVGKGYHEAYWLGICDGYLRFYSRGDEAVVRDATSMAVPLREWTHIAIAVDDTTLKFYINGELVDEFTSDPAPLTTSTHPLRIGSDYSWDYQPWAALDDIRIWDVALSEPDIEGVMSIPPALPAEGLVAEYLLNGSGAEDSAGDHNGAAIGEVDYGTSLPRPFWPDITCSGLVEPADILPLIAYVAGFGEDFPVPEGCEAIGSATY